MHHPAWRPHVLTHLLKRAVVHETNKRWSLFATAAEITLRPSAFADTMAQRPGGPLRAASRFMLLAVGTVLIIEAVFSYVFNTTFSDLIHHAFPILVAATGGLSVYVVLKLLWSRTARFSNTLAGCLYVGGTALVVMIGLIFLFLTFDFAANYNSVMSSGCAPRTIMCLLSGNTQSEYGLMQNVATPETQGGSFSIILWTILTCLVFYTVVLTTVLKRSMDVARWRTSIAVTVSVVLLSPAYLVLLNAIYRWLYASA